MGDHVDILTGFPFSSGKYTESPVDMRLIRGDNVVQGRIRWAGVKRWPKSEVAEYEKYALHAGDVLLAMDRPWIEAGLKYAALTVDDTPALLVQRVARLRVRDGIDQGFLRYVIGSPAFSAYIQAVQTGTAVPHISSGQIRDYECPLPPLPYQQAISRVLGALDAKIEGNRRLVHRAEKWARHSLDDPSISVHAPLGELVTVVKSHVNPADLGEQMVRHFSLPAFDSLSAPEVVKASDIKSGKLALREGVVLFSKLNPRIPRVWLPDMTSDLLSLASTEFLPLLPKEGLTDIDIWAACQQPAFLVEAQARVTGTSGSHQRVRQQDLLALLVRDPRSARPELRATARAMLAYVGGLRRESARLAETRDGLAARLLRGPVPGLAAS